MPNTQFTKRYIIIVDITKTVAANARAAAWDFDTGGGNTFGAVRLSANGQEPATHTACNTAANSAMSEKILEAQSQVPWQWLYDEDAGWTWESALVDAGLQVIEQVI